MAERKHENPRALTITRTDGQHVAALEDGSQTSWGKLYERHRNGLVRFCGNFTSDPNLAEDWAQETFLRLKEKIHTFRSGAELKPWLYKVARNICLRHRRKHREMQWSDSVFATKRISLLDSGPSPASKMLGDELNAGVMRLLGILSEEQRAVFILRYVEDLSRKEIAEVMEIPEATVKSRLCHAMNALREKMNRKA
jgi:RNA polymerase sigma-70 factor (ECF subfamily)